MLRVSFSPAPECVIVVLLESSFSDPRAAQNCYYYCCYTLQIADFLKGPILLGSNPILGTLKCFPSIHLRSHQPSYSHNIYVEGLLFSRPWVCRPSYCWTRPFFGPPRGPRDTVVIVVVVYFIAKLPDPFLRAQFCSAPSRFSGTLTIFSINPFTLRINPVFFNTIYVEGLLFSRPSVCRPSYCWTHPPFSDPPAGPRTPLLLPLYLVLHCKLPDPFLRPQFCSAPSRFSGTLTIFSINPFTLRINPVFSHTIYVEGLLSSRPWVCDRRIVGIEFFGPPRGTKLLLLLLIFLRAQFCSVPTQLLLYIANCWGSPFLPALSKIVRSTGFSPILTPPGKTAPGSISRYTKMYFRINPFPCRIFSSFFSHNIYVEGLLFSRPWVCDSPHCTGFSRFSDPPCGTNGPGLLLLLLYNAARGFYFGPNFDRLQPNFRYTKMIFHHSIYVRINPVIPTTFMLRVSFSPAPECVIVRIVLDFRDFRTPPAAQTARGYYYCCYTLHFAVFF